MKDSIKRKTLKKVQVSLVILIAFFVTTLQTSAEVNKPKSNNVEIIYFHSKNRCATCIAIENLTQEEIKKDFANELKNGTLKFKVVDISKKENKEIATKYEVSWSALYINKWEGEKEISKNMTNFAFYYAKNAPSIFKKGIKENIEKLLK